MNESPYENDYFRVNLSKLLRERVTDDDFFNNCRPVDPLIYSMVYEVREDGCWHC